MATRAQDDGVVTAVGRDDPSLTCIKRLHTEGWFGRIVAVNVTMMGGGALAHSSTDAWMGAKASGANLMTIVDGNTIDAVSYGLSPLAELTMSVATREPSRMPFPADGGGQPTTPDDPKPPGFGRV